MQRIHRWLRNVPQITGKRLLKSGWLLFLISMFLPALKLDGDFFSKPLYWGWECARAVLECLFARPSSLWDGMLQFCAIANLFALVAPLVLWRVQTTRALRFWTGIYLISAANAMCQPLLFHPPDWKCWQIGYYAWVAAFGMMMGGCAILGAHSHRKRAKAEPATNYQPRTPEELAAERELHDYLRSH